MRAIGAYDISHITALASGAILGGDGDLAANGGELVGVENI